VPSLEDEKRVILHWLAHLEQQGECAQAVQWVDSEQGGDIDALAPPFAIEHTSVDALEDQRRYAVQIRALLDSLSDVIVSTSRLRLILDRTGFGTVGHRQLLACLKQWIPSQTPNLPEGQSSGQQLCDLNCCSRQSEEMTSSLWMNCGLQIPHSAMLNSGKWSLTKRSFMVRSTPDWTRPFNPGGDGPGLRPGRSPAAPFAAMR